MLGAWHKLLILSDFLGVQGYASGGARTHNLWLKNARKELCKNVQLYSEVCTLLQVCLVRCGTVIGLWPSLRHQAGNQNACQAVSGAFLTALLALLATKATVAAQ